MKIDIVKKVITTYHFQVEKVEKNFICSYESDCIPRTDEVIRINGETYKVRTVIHVIEEGVEKIIIEVKPYSTTHEFIDNNVAWRAEVPLVIDMEKDVVEN